MKEHGAEKLTHTQGGDDGRKGSRMMMQTDTKVGRAETEAAELLVLTHCEGEPLSRPDAVGLNKVLGGSLRDLLQSREFEGRAGEALVYHTHGKVPAKRLLLVGLGKKHQLTLDAIRQALGHAVKRVRQCKVDSFAAVVPAVTPKAQTPLEVAQAMTEGAILGNYQFTAYRSDNGTPINVERMTILTEAKKIAKEEALNLKILEQKDMEQLGMGALLGVARGSHEPPKFIILEYNGAKKKDERPVVLIGKTITFDTGGISLKPAENMEHMKADMTGGAEVLAAVRAAARLRLPLRLVSILPVAENMPGGRAMKPGDIVKTLSGKTVEVQNTDAEGRLILADALAYAQRYNPVALVDIATLTGACVVALGQFAIGMFGTDDKLKAQVQKSGQKSGERVWEMPLWEEYFEQLRSDVADMRNIGGRGGGMITAALFLSKFAGDGPWVHIDIASTDWSERERAYIPKGPTGIGTRLLIQYLIDRSL
jgi:leucyl aminopeptidase